MRDLVRFAALPIASLIAVSSTPAVAAIIISSVATKNISCSAGLCVPTAKHAVLNAGDLTSMLAAENVEVSTSRGSLATDIEDIIVDDSFSWSSANSLTLDAYRSITFRTGSVSVTGIGAVSLVTNNESTGGGLSFTPGASLFFASTNNSLTINGTVFALESSIAALASAIVANPSGSFALANKYDASQDGVYRRSPIETGLQGSVEGLGNTISNLSIISPPMSTPPNGEAGLGLFSGIDHGAIVSDLTLANLNYHISGGDYVVGGLVGLSAGSMANDYASGSIAGSGGAMGGLAGYNNGTISSSHASVSLNAVKASEQISGGLVGTNLGTIISSSADGAVLGAEMGGGLIGQSYGNIAGCFSTGRVASSLSSAQLGGLVGEDGSEIQNSYATGSVKSPARGTLGGLIGVSQPGGSYDYSYASGRVSRYGAGFVGDGGEGIELTSSYWDITTSKTNQGNGEGNENGLTGLTSAQLKSGLPDGFDPKIWRETKGINHGFPYLINNPPPKD